MATRLQDFREQYPQYRGWSDEDLAEGLRKKYYADMDIGEYRRQVGLSPLPEPEPEPTIGQRINKALFDRGKKVDPLTTPDAEPEVYMDPEGFEIDVTRPILKNRDGTFSTEETIGVEFDGRQYNIPTIVKGERVSRQEAEADARARMAEGWIFPNFDTIEEADQAAQRRSDSIAGARAQAQASRGPVLDPDEIKAMQGWLGTVSPRPELGGLSESQFGEIHDWLRPHDPALLEELKRDYELHPPPPGNPLLDQVFAGWDELMAGHNTIEALDIAKEFTARQRGEITPTTRREGMARAMLGRGAETPEAYMERLTGDLQQVLDTRRERRQRSQATLRSPAARRMLERETFFEVEGEITPEEAFAGERGTVSQSGALSELADSPITIIFELGLRSAANMAEIIPLAIAGGAAAGPWGFAAGIGIGSGMVEYRHRLTELIERAGYDMNVAEDVLAIAGDHDLLAEFSSQAALESGIIGAFDLATGSVATKTIVPGVVKNTVAREITNVVLQTGVQALGGGGGEVGAQLARGEGIHAGEIIAEMAAEGMTAPVDVGAATISGVRTAKTERAIANAIADVYEKLDTDVEADVQDDTGPRVELPPDITQLAHNEVLVDNKIYQFKIEQEIPTDEGNAYDVIITMPDGQKVPITLKAGESIEDVILNRILPHYEETAAGEYQVITGNYNLADPIGGEGAEIIQFSQRADGTGFVIRGDGTPVDVTNMIRAGMSPEQIIAQTFAENTDGSTVTEITPEPPPKPEIPDEQARIKNLSLMALMDEMKKARAQVIDAFADEATGTDIRNELLMHFQNLVRQARTNIDQMPEEMQEQARAALDTIAKLPEAPPAAPPDTPPAPPDPPSAAVSYLDNRLKRRIYRQRLTAMADELVFDGGSMGTLTREEAYPGELEDTGERTGQVITRLPSQNPAWYQDNFSGAIADQKMDTVQLANAVIKAIRGVRLGVRQQRVIGTMLDIIQDVRESEVDHARAQLEQAREIRRQARSRAGIPPDENETQSGEQFDDDEYSPDMTATSRIIHELMEQATAAGIDEQVLEDLAVRLADASDGAIIQALEELINEHKPTAGPQEVAPEPPPTEEPGPETEAAIRPPEEPQLGAMPREEMIEILYTDPLTGIANRRAFQEEGQDHAFLASIDADSTKFINDHLGHDAGGAMLIAIAQALDQSDVTAYHISGAEFYLGADKYHELTSAIELAKATLRTVHIRSDRGIQIGVEITYGIGESKNQADTVMEMQKKEREASGKRQPRGSAVAPPGFSMRIPLEPQVDAQAGTNYQGFIGRHGDLPADANHNYQLGDGRTVQIPKKPLRARQVISQLQRVFGHKIYQGRVKGKTQLGFYRAGIGEVRTKHFNDLETVAHEISHWFDDRYPWIRTLYRQHADEVKTISYDDKKVWEGFAEFMRNWFTQDYKAYKGAPGFYDAFMLALEQHPKEGKAMLEMQMLMHAWHLQGARARAAGKQGLGKESITDRFRDMFEDLPDKILQRTFDEIRQFKQVERAIRGGVASPQFSGYASLRLAKGLHGMILAISNKGAIGWNAQGDIEFVGKSLNEIFDQVKGNLEEFVQYMIGRRAQELNRQKRENNYRPDEISAMLSYAGDPGNENFATVFDEWLEFNRQMLDFYQASGLLTDASRIYIDEMNKNYVPFNRIVDGLMGARVKRGGGPFIRLKGGTANINDVMESIIGNMSYLVHMSMVNVGKRNFYNMILGQQGSIRGIRRTAGNTEAGNYAVPIPKDATPAFIHKEMVVRAVLEGMGLSMAWYKQASMGMVADETELAVVAMIDQMKAGMEELVMFFQTGQDPQGNVDFFFDYGEKRFFEIIDPLLYEAIGHLGPQSHNLAVSILGGFANVLRRGVVLTPTFQIKNFVRDTGNAFTLSRGKIMPIKDALVALMERIYNDEHYWLYMANGGGFASIAEAEGIASDRIVDSPEKLFAMYDRMISTFEYANRIAEFKVLQRKGATAREAALAGREISTDFAMHGSSDAIRVLTISVPFLNARMQGLYRNVRELAHLPPGKRLGFAGRRAFNYATRSLMTITLPSLYLYAVNKDDERYKEIPDWIRDLNWIIFYGKGEDDYFLIPKPFESGMIWGTVPERALEYYYKRDESELADAMLWMAMQTFALDITPQAFQPWLELRRNRKFTGAPVIPGYLKDVLPQEQWRYYTSDTMIALGRRFNISPMKAEHLVRGHFGTLGAWALGAADYMIGDLSTGGERPAWDPWRENIITSPFVNKGPLRRTKSEDDLYELLQETREVATAMSQMHRRNPQYIEEFLESDAERQAYLGLNATLMDSAAKMGELKNAMDMVASDPAMDGEQKRKIIDELQRAKNEVAHETRQAIDPQMVRELIEQIEQKLEQERLDQQMGIARAQ